MKPYRSTHHPGHVLYRADSKAMYPQHNGNWFCDHCRQEYNPKHAPYHCFQTECEFDLCANCMKDAGKNFNHIPYRFPTVSPFTNCLRKYNVYNLYVQISVILSW